MKYLGNFGDASPLEYHGLFMWYEGPPEGIDRVKAKLKGVSLGTLHAIKTQNWCDATGECENEQRVLVNLGMSLDLAWDFQPDSWIKWDAIANYVGSSVAELKRDPVWAFDAAISYHGELEFSAGYGEEFIDSFREVAELLVRRGVPKEEMEYYLDYPTPEEEAEEED